MLLAKIAHEKLLDLQRAGVPPRQPDQKCICARAARQARGFRIQKKPFRWIGQRRPHALRERFVPAAGKQFETYLGNVGILRRRKPVAHQDVLPVAICGDSCAEQARQRILRMRRAKQLRARRPRPSRLQCRKSRKFVSEGRHHAHNRSRMANASSIRVGEGTSAASGGRSPTAAPRSRPSHISNSVATDSSACSSPNIPLCRSLTVNGSESSSGRSSVIQYEVVCISFSGSSSFPAPTFSFVKNLIFLKPTTCERTSTSP